MTTRRVPGAHVYAARPAWLRTPVALLLSLLLIVLAVPVQAVAQADGVSFTDGGVVVDGVRYARQGDTVELTVVAPSDTKCMVVSGAHQAERSGGQLASTQVFDFQAGEGDGYTEVAVEIFTNAGCNQGGSDFGSAKYLRDNTAPTVTGELQADNLGDNGWYTGEVTVAWTCTDDGSGVGAGACPEDSVHDLGEGADRTATSPSVGDRVGNEAAGSVTGIKVDSTAPVSTADAPDGWKSGNVTIELGASDNLSGVADTFYRLKDEESGEAGSWESYDGSLFYEDEGWYELEYRSVDKAGNVEAIRSVGFGIDKTAPGVTTSQDPPANAAGWNNRDVTVSFECIDEGPSGIFSCQDDITVTDEVENHPVRGTAVDNAGNESTAERRVSIDKTAPTVFHSISGTSDNGDWYTSAVTITYTCSDPASNGVASGIASCPSSETLEDDGADQSGEQVSAEDAAGNTSDPLTAAGIDIDRTAPTTTAGNVPADWVNETVEVTLAATDGGPSGVAATYYRVDSGTQQTYDGPIRFAQDGSYTLTYWSVDVAGNIEMAQYATIRVDSAAPISTVSLSDSDWTNQPVTVTLSAEDEEGGSGLDVIRYQLDGGVVQEYDDSFAVSDHGQQTLTYWAVDNAGNVEEKQTTTILIDTVVPVLTGAATASNQGNGGWYVDDITVRWTCSDLDSGIDGACPDDTVLTQEGSDLSASEHVYDKAGNRTDATVDTLKLDRTAPSTVASVDVDANDAGWNSEDVTVDLTATDELSGVTTTSYRIDGGAWQTSDHVEDGPVKVTFTEDGVYRLEYRSEDVAGNVETVDSIDLKVDQSAPTITSSQSPQSNQAGWNNEAVTVSFQCTDDGPSGIASCTPPVVVDQEVEDHKVKGTAVDHAGNSAETDHAVNIDFTDPEVASTVSGEPGTGGWFTGPVTVTFQCADPGSVASGVPAGTCPAEQVLTNDGSGQVTTAVTVDDRAGNRSEAHVRTGIDIDQTAPVTTAGNVPDGWTNGPVNVQLSATDNLSNVATIEYRIGSDGDFQEYDAPIGFTDHGTHTLYYRSVDGAGNVETTNTATVRIDLVDPQTTASGLPDTDWTNESVMVTLTATDTGGSGVDTTHYRIGDGDEQIYHDPVELTDEGVYEFAYWSVDGAGNVEEENEVTVRIDKTAPQTTSDAPSGWQTQTVTVTLAASDSGGSNVATTYYTVDGGAEQEYTGPFELAEGVTDLAFWSIDGAGNVEAASTARVQADLTDPDLKVTAPTNNSSTSATSVTVEGTASDDASGVRTVTVNGENAAYDANEGSFQLANVALDCGPNTLTVEAIDAAGRTSEVQVLVERRCATVTSVDRPLQTSSQGDVKVNDLRGNRVVPVKVEVEYLNEAYTGANATLGSPTISLRKLPDCEDIDGVEALDAESAGNANTDDWFRADGDSWIYNLSSRDLEPGVCYRVDVRLEGVRASNALWTVVRAR